jgi:hypothetical protein
MIPSDEMRERTKSFSLGFSGLGFRNMSVIAIHLSRHHSIHNGGDWYTSWMWIWETGGSWAGLYTFLFSHHYFSSYYFFSIRYKAPPAPYHNTVVEVEWDGLGS